MSASDFERELSRIKYEPCKKCGERKGHTIFRGKGWLQARCNWCSNLREFKIIPKRRRNAGGFFSSLVAKAQGRKHRAPGLISTARQRKAAKIARRRRGFTPGAIAASSEARGKAMSAIASDVALALKQQGYSSAAAKKAARSASGSDFNSKFRDALRRVRANPMKHKPRKRKKKNSETRYVRQYQAKKPLESHPQKWALYDRIRGRRKRVGTAKSELEKYEFLVGGRIPRRNNPRSLATAIRKFFPPSRFRIKRVNPERLVDAIRHGDRVTIVDRFGKQRTGKAVMRSSTGGWVLNMGGRYGTPGLADDSNVVRVKK